MNGLTKLKLAILILLVLMIIAIIGATITVTMEESDVADAYDSLSYDDQLAVERFSNKLTDYTNIYAIFGYMQYAVALGLFILITKLWNMKKI
jgi:cytochrome c biogenesis protein ResB